MSGEQLPIELFYPVLADVKAVQEAILECYGDASSQVLSDLRSKVPSEIIRSEVRDLLLELVIDTAEVVESFDGLGYPDVFSINIMSFNEIYWIDAEDFDHIGYFKDADAARIFALSNYEPFITAYKESEDELDGEA